MKIKNINSTLFDSKKNTINKIKISKFEGELEKLNQDFWQGSNNNHSPIFLVNEDLMDIIYPPKKKLGIINTNINDDNELLDKDPKSYDSITVGLGVHFKLFDYTIIFPQVIGLSNDLGTLWKDTLDKLTDFANQRFPEVIFICPERIKTNADNTSIVASKKKSFRALFILTILHEIAHGYMASNENSIKNTDNWYAEYWGKLIEESFANIMAWAQLGNKKDREIAEEFMGKQPLEYTLYSFWKKGNKEKAIVPMLISAWLNGEQPISNLTYLKNISEYLENYPGILAYNKLNETLNYKFESEIKNTDLIKELSISVEKSWELIAKAMLIFNKSLNDYLSKNNKQVLIYEIESTGNSDYSNMLSTNKDCFYWNKKCFSNLKVGDFVFIINNEIKEVMFTEIDNTSIPATANGSQSTFTDNKITYINSRVLNKEFVKMKINKCYSYSNPEWKLIGAINAESTYIFGERADKSTLDKKLNRIENIKILKAYFSTDSHILSILKECEVSFY